MRRVLFLSLLCLAVAATLQISTGPTPSQAQGPLGRAYIWADCEMFLTVGTPATFMPDHGPFDELYGGGNGFKDGVGAISESKPGDQDYNGGRWHKNVLKSTVDPDKYSDACSVDDLDLNDFESTNEYFECPLQPRRGQGHQ